VPGYRQIVDLSPANNSRFIDAVGMSGHFLSRHYDDFITDWRDVRDRKMRMTRADVDSGALGMLRLTPAQERYWPAVESALRSLVRRLPLDRLVQGGFSLSDLIG